MKISFKVLFWRMYCRIIKCINAMTMSVTEYNKIADGRNGFSEMMAVVIGMTAINNK